jgi:hypothetical protein
MEKNSNEELLWKYTDGLCNAEEIAKVKILLENDTDLASVYKCIFKTDMMLKDAKNDALNPVFQNQLELKLKSALAIQDFSPVTIIPQYAKTVFYILLGILGLFLFLFIPKDVLFTEYTDFSVSGNTFYYNMIAVSAGILLLLYFDKFIGKHGNKNQKLHILF